MSGRIVIKSDNRQEIARELYAQLALPLLGKEGDSVSMHGKVVSNKGYDVSVRLLTTKKGRDIELSATTDFYETEIVFRKILPDNTFPIYLKSVCDVLALKIFEHFEKVFKVVEYKNKSVTVELAILDAIRSAKSDTFRKVIRFINRYGAPRDLNIGQVKDGNDYTLYMYVNGLTIVQPNNQSLEKLQSEYYDIVVRNVPSIRKHIDLPAQYVGEDE